MGDFGRTAVQDRWVCPNDRQLALRAKLKAGWSVKTSQLQSYVKPQQINDYEQESIKNVIKRAERIEKKEQERIGHLVAKLDKMRKNVVGNGGNQCILCAYDFGLMGASSLACNDCKKVVCTKCGVNTFSAHKEPLWLCIICAETREMWKKSGAWFFKGLPKYLLPPGKKSDQREPGGHRQGAHKFDKGDRNKQGREFNTWSHGNEDGRFPNDLQDDIFENGISESSSDEDSISLGRTKIVRHVDNSDSLSVGARSSPNATSPSCLEARSARSSISQISPDSSSADAKRDHSDNDIFEMTEAHSLHSVHSGRTGEGTYTEDEEDVDRVFSTYRRRGSQASTGRNGQNPQAATIKQPQPAEPQSNASYENRISPDDTAYGTLEFSVLYDSINNALHCTVHRARGLRAMDSNGLSDPYVKLHLLPDTNKSINLRTKTVHKTLNPEFNETLTYYGITENDMLRRTLRLSVLDEDTFGHDFIGEVRVQLDQIRAHQTKQFNVYLSLQYPLKKYEDILCGNRSRGKILLSLQYSTRKQGLVVGIVRCSHLPPMDSNGFSDPFAKIQLKPDPHKKKYKTCIKWRNLNPQFNEEFVFDVKLQDLTKRILQIAVWDKDYGRTNDYIGGLQIGINSKGERLRHWLNVLKNPDQQYDKWHYLGEDVLSD